MRSHITDLLAHINREKRLEFIVEFWQSNEADSHVDFYDLFILREGHSEDGIGLIVRSYTCQ
jgi:hypothetical protein